MKYWHYRFLAMLYVVCSLLLFAVPGYGIPFWVGLVIDGCAAALWVYSIELKEKARDR